jgi:hypothetical protein
VVQRTSIFVAKDAKKIPKGAAHRNEVGYGALHLKIVVDMTTTNI